ncbi:uncharacterized protein [Neodiprion pinetum]|uniref:uncharacterized protein isoform X1 n=1 Tax=Neodiprion pinetum TaxID=441929 RepID=UPI001EDFFC45|nr:uncharacterized protein LOC124215378 isoform X1 [Neodiprion pinetum]
MLTAYEKYNEIGTSIEAVRDMLTMDHLVDFLSHPLLTNSRLTRVIDDLDAMEIEKNWLSYVNVLNYINEKDYWVSTSSSDSISKQHSSLCTSSRGNMLSDGNAEKSPNVFGHTRGQKRTRKRTVTLAGRKHYKLERLAQLSDSGSFRVTESLYDLLKNSWDFGCILKTKRRFRSNCGGLRKSILAKYRKKHRETDWKNENLTLFIRKMNGMATPLTEKENQRNSEVKTSLLLPSKVDQLLRKLERFDPSLYKIHCSCVRRKFHTKLYNVCSCLNNLLSRMNGKMINSTYLVCEIRKDYLNFKLKRTPPLKCNSCLFSARVMTCDALDKCKLRKGGSRQRLISQSFWASKKADELLTGGFVHEDSSKACKSENTDVTKDEVNTSIEISCDNCGDGVGDQKSAGEGSACDLKDIGNLKLRYSSSISEVLQKLALSPFRLQETEQSYKLRSKIRDIVRSLMICTCEKPVTGHKATRSISIQAIVSSSSLEAIKHERKVLPVESKSSKALSVSKILSFVERKIFPSKSKKDPDRKIRLECKRSAQFVQRPKLHGAVKSKNASTAENYLKAKEQGTRCRRSVRPNKSVKSQESSSSREAAKPKHKSKFKTSAPMSGGPLKSKEFTSSQNYPLPKELLASIASEISYALARSNSPVDFTNADEPDDLYDISVTVEIEESSQLSDNDTESVSRDTHLLPSMKSVKLGTCPKYLTHDSSESTPSSPLSSSSSSSRNEVIVRDNFTTMNKSMRPSSHRGTISADSYDRMRCLIRQKVCKKLSDTDSCRPNSSKTVVSTGKYYFSIPSSKTSRDRLKHKISESPSTSHDSLRLPVSNPCRHMPGRSPSSSSQSRESSSRKIPDSYCVEIENEDCTQSSVAVTFDNNSTYGCVQDRLANRHLKDIINDYSDEAEDSSRHLDDESHICRYRSTRVNDFRPCIDEKLKNGTSRYCNLGISSEENSESFGRTMPTDDDTSANIGMINDSIEHSDYYHPGLKSSKSYVVGSAMVQNIQRFNDCQRFEKVGYTRRAAGWSTCTIRSSSLWDCRIDDPPSNHRPNVRDNRCEWPQQKTLSIFEKYKKGFRIIDRTLRVKLLQYVDLCKNAKNSFQKQVCLDDMCEASRTSILPSDSRRYKYSGVYFGG